MSNSLNRDLRVGDKVVVAGYTMVVDQETFGSKARTRGTAIILRMADAEAGTGERYSGWDIDKDETIKRHAKDNRWDDAQPTPSV